MSDGGGHFDFRYEPPAKAVSPDQVVEEFTPEVFARLEKAEPLPDPTENFDRLKTPAPPPPDPFEEFKVGRRAVSELMAEMPSLDGLFKPFDLAADKPDEKFSDLTDFNAPKTFDYEDLDTRDPNVIRTLAQAEARNRETLAQARSEGFAVVEAARTEAQGLIAEARARAGAEAETRAEQIRREAEVALNEAQKRLTEAESQKAGAEELKALAEKDRSEAESHLAAVKDRIAGLDQERRTMEEELESRRQNQEDEHRRLSEELESRREATLSEARETGRREGLEQGLAEGRTRGREEGLAPWRAKTEELAAMLERLENIHRDLWLANGPMMVKLAIDAAEQILNKELREAEDLTVRAFEACVGFLGQAHQVVFQARPQDIARLEEAKAEQRQRLGALVKVSFQPDESLGPGDLIMESDVGRLDATVKHRAARVLEVLRDAFEGAPGGLAAPEPPAAPPAAPDEEPSAEPDDGPLPAETPEPAAEGGAA